LVSRVKNNYKRRNFSLSKKIWFAERVMATLTSLVFVMLLTSCNTATKIPPPMVHPETQADLQTEQEYRIRIGDQMSIKFFYNPGLNEQVTVRPDGRISLQLVHEVVAVGLTPAELTDFLTAKYATEIKDPEIAVIIRSFSAQKVFVGGEVNKPGLLDLLTSMTVLQSISLAEGFKDTARIKEILVIRRKADNKTQILPINLDDVIKGIDNRQDIILLPYDIVYVPRSKIANVNQWVDQYIRKNIPIPFSYSLRPN